MAALVPHRARLGNKWSAAVLVVAGSPGMTGAAGLCARAAYRAGAGMVRLGVPGLALAHSPATEAVGVFLPDEGWAPAALDAASRCSAVVVGPGLGPHRRAGGRGDPAGGRRRPCRWWWTPTASTPWAGSGGDRVPSRPGPGWSSPPTTASTPGWSAPTPVRTGSPPPAPWPAAPVRCPCSRDRPPRWPIPTAGSAWPGRAPPPWPPPVPGTSCPGSSGPSWPAGSTRSTPPPSPPTCTAGPVRSAFGEGLVAGDLPDLVPGLADRCGAAGRAARRRSRPWLTAGARRGPTSTSTPCGTTPACSPTWSGRRPSARW